MKRRIEHQRQHEKEKERVEKDEENEEKGEEKRKGGGPWRVFKAPILRSLSI